MRTVIARIFDYSIDGVIATDDTPFFDFCRELPDDTAMEERNQALYADADLHIMGRVTYQGMAQYFPTATDHPYAEVMNKGRKAVLPIEHVSSTLFGNGVVGLVYRRCA